MVQNSGKTRNARLTKILPSAEPPCGGVSTIWCVPEACPTTKPFRAKNTFRESVLPRNKPEAAQDYKMPWRGQWENLSTWNCLRQLSASAYCMHLCLRIQLTQFVKSNSWMNFGFSFMYSSCFSTFRSFINCLSFS